MKSIKPGRGPSMMGGIGSIAVGLFGVFWTIGAASMGAPGFFVLFGIIFIGIAIAQAVFNFKNATGKNRMSIYDITDNEPDPLEKLYGKQRVGNEMGSGETKPRNEYHDASVQNSSPAGYNGTVNFCPNCGQNVSGKTYNYCPGCGNEINMN